MLVRDQIEGYVRSTVCMLSGPPGCRKDMGTWSEIESYEMGGLHKSELAIFVIDSAFERRMFMAR